jgi:hypothetical protein
MDKAEKYAHQLVNIALESYPNVYPTSQRTR